MATAQGQFTIIDYNDAITLAGYIESNHPKNQTYSPDKDPSDAYSPDYSVNPLILTPLLFVAGDQAGVNIIQSSAVKGVTWYRGDSDLPITNGNGFELTGDGVIKYILKINSNDILSAGAVDFRVKIDYLDSKTDLLVPFYTNVTINRTVNGTGIVSLSVTTPNGYIFKNGEVASKIARADFNLGSNVDENDVTYQWYKMDPGSAGDAISGPDWEVLSDSSKTDSDPSYYGTRTKELTVFSKTVDSYATFRCIATVGGKDRYSDVASFADMTDPLYVEIRSTGGSAFKNGEGVSDLTAYVYQAGELVPDNKITNYRWQKYDKDGASDSSFTQEGKSLKSIRVDNNDVFKKATFAVEVTVSL